MKPILDHVSLFTHRYPKAVQTNTDPYYYHVRFDNYEVRYDHFFDAFTVENRGAGTMVDGLSTKQVEQLMYLLGYERP